MAILTFEEAAKFLKLSQTTLREQLKRGELKGTYKKLGRQWRFSEQAIMKYLERDFSEGLGE